LNDETPPEIHRRPTGWALGQLSWFLALVVSAFILALWLVSKGSKGNEISGALSLPVSIVGLGITVLLFKISREKSEPDNNNGREVSAAPPESVRRRLRLAALVTAIGLGVGGGFFYWTVIHKADIPVTDRVVVSGGQGMQNDGRATIQIPGTPPQRSHLALIPTLTNHSPVGDCVNPAQLDITPVIDGQHRPFLSLRSGDEARLDLTGVTHQASVIVALHEQDPFCMVDLDVDQAVLYN
jgi:hypothetical protein